MITSLAIATIAIISLATGFLCGMSWGSDKPAKAAIEELNALEETSHKLRKSDAEATRMRFHLIRIEAHFAAQQSGTAQLAAKMARMGLGK